MKYLRLLLPLVGLMVLGCQKDSVTIAESYIEEDLVPYFERFKEEGAARGIVVDYELANISAYLENIGADNVSGQCIHSGEEAKRLVIDIEFWRQATDIRKEFVVFHELGHCFLNRGHLETELADGTCESMMHSGLSGCRNAFNNLTRSYYLDELFLAE